MSVMVVMGKHSYRIHSVTWMAMEWRIIRNDAIIRKVQNTTETLEGFEPEG